jgi:hypothetical protein
MWTWNFSHCHGLAQVLPLVLNDTLAIKEGSVNFLSRVFLVLVPLVIVTSAVISVQKDIKAVCRILLLETPTKICTIYVLGTLI